MDVDKSSPFTSDISIPFYTEKEAEIAYNSLRVDKEPSRGGCTKSMSVAGNKLEVKFTATDAKKLRVGINSFLDTLSLVIETIEQFGPPADT